MSSLSCFLCSSCLFPFLRLPLPTAFSLPLASAPPPLSSVCVMSRHQALTSVKSVDVCEEGSILVLEHFSTLTESLLLCGTKRGKIHAWDLRAKKEVNRTGEERCRPERSKLQNQKEERREGGNDERGGSRSRDKCCKERAAHSNSSFSFSSFSVCL